MLMDTNDIIDVAEILKCRSFGVEFSHVAESKIDVTVVI